MLGFKLNDGQTCNAGLGDLSHNHIFDPNKKITRIEHFMHQDESGFSQTNFYHNQERLAYICLIPEHASTWHDVYRREVFEIAEDEQLIGCELHHNDWSCLGVTWLKMKISA